MVARPTHSSGAAGEPPTLLSGRGLAVARLASTVLAASAAVVSIVGLPALYAEFRALEYLDPAARDVAHDNLSNLGLSVDFYAAYVLVFGTVLTLACFAVAAVILWRRSDEPMALFVAVMLALLGATFSGSRDVVLRVIKGVLDVIPNSRGAARARRLFSWMMHRIGQSF